LGDRALARGRLEFLRSEEIRRIHDTSIRILEQVGVLVHSKNVLRSLLENGATASDVAGKVLLPEEMVKAALASAPKSVLLASRDKTKDIKIPSKGKLFVCNGGEGIYVRDLLNGTERPSTLDDYIDFARLVEAIPQLDYACGMVGALDAPLNLKDVLEMKASLEFTTKHFQGGASNREEARSMIKLASIVAGGEDELAKRPIFSCTECPISPLTFESGLAEAQVEFAKAGIPVVAMVASVAGLTSPVTLSGSIAQVNAENLASLVITQTAKRYAPWIYSSDSVPGNLTTGSIDYGALEANLLRTGAGQMGKFYGLPTMVAGIGIEETSTLLGTPRDGVPYMVVQGLMPSDLGSGMGGLDQAAGASFEQLLVDAWVWDLAREFIREFDADDSAISFETIRDAALDGNFLAKRHTLSRFKKEFAAIAKPEAGFSGRGSSGSPGDVVKKAKVEVEKMLKRPRRPVVSKGDSKEMNDFVESLR